MIVTGWPGSGNCWAGTGVEKRIREKTKNLNMLPSVDRLVIELTAGNRHDPFPGELLDARGALKVDRLAFLEHRMDRGLVLQDADVLERIAVHHQHVGILAR